MTRGSRTSPMEFAGHGTNQIVVLVAKISSRLFSQSRCGWVLGMLLVMCQSLGAEEPPTPAGIAVVELFTSEGCSSCPPADRLLSEIRAAAEKSGKPVYVLSHHVEYWDRLGWKDPYGTSSSTSRQHAYARRFNNNQVYTPQMVVNGSAEFVGSDRKRAQAVIEQALKRGQSVPLTATATLSDGKIKLTTEFANSPADCSLIAALVQRDGTQQVTAGENSRRTLAHVNIVRALHTSRLTAAGQHRTEFALPKDLKPTEVELIVFVQNKAGAILGAVRCVMENSGAER